MSRIAAATSRAFPTSVWMRMYAWTTTRLLSAARARPAVKLPHRKVTTGRPGEIRWSRRGMEGAMTVATTGEFGLIARVTSRLGRESSADSRPDFGGNCLLGPGDDAAVVATPDGRAVLSTDVLVEGRHFRRDWSGARDVGHRAAAANMADIAAMGAVPTALVVALCAPADLAASWAEELADGLAAEASLVGAAVVGGDMSASGTLTIAVTAVGDLGHVATASGVGIDLRREAFPVPAQMRDAAAALGVDPYTWILAGGDDHPLAATFPPGTDLPADWLVIGSVVEGRGVTLDGQPYSGGPAGWDHFRT